MPLDYSLQKEHTIYDWYAQSIPKDSVNLLRVGDCVRVNIKRNPHKMRKRYSGWICNEKGMYFEITKIDRYKYGGIHKPRKFHGKAIDVYNQFDGVDYMKEGQEITFRPENIYEIPSWNEKNPLSQKNKEKLSRFDYRWDAPEYDEYIYYKENPEDEKPEKYQKLF